MYGEKLSWFARFMQRFQTKPIDLVRAELADAKIAVLESHSKAEYSALGEQIHLLTAQYHQGRIERLQNFLDETSELDAFANGKIVPLVRHPLDNKDH
jgi:hypothetical protein